MTISENISLLLKGSFIRFCIVGGAAFFVDATVLQTLRTFLDFSPVTARVFSFLVSLTFTWLLNRRFTFQINKRISLKEWFWYLAINCLSTSINWSSYLLLIFSFDIMFDVPVLALIGATSVSLFVNYFGLKKYAFAS